MVPSCAVAVPAVDGKCSDATHDIANFNTSTYIILPIHLHAIILNTCTHAFFSWFDSMQTDSLKPGKFDVSATWQMHVIDWK